VESVLGDGATFGVYFPMARTVSTPSRTVPDAAAPDAVAKLS
jgi:two-component system phosphate regulon sensor histidine kinase PhoR